MKKVIEENGRSSKSKSVRNEIERFREDPTKNIELLYRSLQKGTFVFPPAKGIPLPKDKSPGAVATLESIRPIVLAKVESRIVQRSVLNVLTGLPGLQRYIENPHSFGGLRKTEPRKLSAVPAAVTSVLGEIGAGAKFVMSADISGFFTRISKSTVTSIISEAAADPEFVEFFEKAIHVELANMAELRELRAKFPIEDIGVAQGNSLSPLLGNVLLNDFDHQMNAGDLSLQTLHRRFYHSGPKCSGSGVTHESGSAPSVEIWNGIIREQNFERPDLYRGWLRIPWDPICERFRAAIAESTEQAFSKY